MLYHVDARGRLSTEDRGAMRCSLIVFTTNSAPASVTVINWRVISPWQMHWTGYVHDSDTMEAFRLLAGYTPSEFYQLRVLAHQLQRQAFVAGPFILPCIGGEYFGSAQLEKWLKSLSERDLVAALNSMRLGKFLK